MSNIFPILKLKSKTFGIEVINALKTGRPRKLFGEIRNAFSAGL